MSNAMYNKMWHQTQEDLGSLLVKEAEKRTEPLGTQAFILQLLATFYVNYVQIFRDLEDVYDQMVHPQKRILIRKILDGVMGRILELKHEMVELELTEFQYFDDILQDLKLAPQQLDIPIPKYFLKEKLEVVKGREKILSQILADTGFSLSDKKYPIKPMPLEEAVKVIQVSERARQGRLRAMFMKQIYLQDCRAKQARLSGEKFADMGAAALRIQKVWRGFRQCKRTEREREEEMIFLGMSPPLELDGHQLIGTHLRTVRVVCQLLLPVGSQRASLGLDGLEQCWVFIGFVVCWFNWTSICSIRVQYQQFSMCSDLNHVHFLMFPSLVCAMFQF